MARLERAAPIAAVGLILGASGIAAYAAKTADDDVFYACLKKGRLTDVGTSKPSKARSADPMPSRSVGLMRGVDGVDLGIAELLNDLLWTLESDGFEHPWQLLVMGGRLARNSNA